MCRYIISIYNINSNVIMGKSKTYQSYTDLWSFGFSFKFFKIWICQLYGRLGGSVFYFLQHWLAVGYLKLKESTFYLSFGKNKLCCCLFLFKLAYLSERIESSRRCTLHYTADVEMWDAPWKTNDGRRNYYARYSKARDGTKKWPRECCKRRPQLSIL